MSLALHSRYPEKGNALFLILIAVVLFAALSYAITQSNRSSGNATQETTAVKAAAIMGYADDIRMAYTRLNLHNDLSLSSNPSLNSFTDPAISSLPVKQQIFSPQGGGVGLIAPYDSTHSNSDKIIAAQGWALAYDSLNDIGVWYGPAFIDGIGSGTTPNEVVQIAVKDQSTCQAINLKILGQSIVPNTVPLQNGDYIDGAVGLYGGGNCTQCSGHSELCVMAMDVLNANPLNGPYIYYALLNQH